MARIADDSFELAWPIGTAITTTNTGYGSSSGTGARVSVAGIHGGLVAAKFSSTAVGGALSQGQRIFSDAASMHWRGYVKWDANPSSTVAVLVFKDSASTVTLCNISITAAGALVLRDSTSTTVETSPSAPGAATVVEIEVDITTGGQYRVKAQWGANLDTATYNWTSSTYTAPTTAVGRVHEGPNAAIALDFTVDDVLIDTFVQPGPTATRTTYLVDTFNRANGALGTSDSGTAWTQLNGQVNVVSNQAGQGTYVAPAALAYVACAVDVDIRFRFSVYSTGSCSVVFRLVDINNYWSINQSTAAVGISRRDAGTAASTVYVNPGATSDSWRVIAKGPTIYFYRDPGTTGTWLLQDIVLDTAYATAGTGVGLAHFNNTLPRMDDLLVQDAPADPLMGQYATTTPGSAYLGGLSHTADDYVGAP